MLQRHEARSITNLPRQVSGGSGLFGDVRFEFVRAVRRADDTMFVQVKGELGPASLVRLFEVLAPHGVAELSLGSTACRAKPVAWDPDVNAMVFELAQ